MNRLLETILRLKIWKDSLGQELVEYALVAGFLVTVCAAASPAIASSLLAVMTQVGSTLTLCSNSTGQVGN